MAGGSLTPREGRSSCLPARHTVQGEREASVHILTQTLITVTLVLKVMLKLSYVKLFIAFLFLYIFPNFFLVYGTEIFFYYVFSPRTYFHSFVYYCVWMRLWKWCRSFDTQAIFTGHFILKTFLNQSFWYSDHFRLKQFVTQKLLHKGSWAPRTRWWTQFCNYSYIKHCFTLK